MLRKLFFSFMALTIFFVIENESAEAASIISIEEIDNLVNKNKSIYYVSNLDVMAVDFYGTRLRSGTIQYYHDGSFTVKGAFREYSASSGAWFKSVHLACTGFYEVVMYLGDGTKAITIRGAISEGDMKVDSCNSDFEEPIDSEVVENSCSSKICECIANLQAPLDSIKESVDKATNELVILNQTASEIKGVLTDFADEFKTDIGYSVPDLPDVSDLMEQNKPVQRETPFTDNNTYFEDAGDAVDPGKLPIAPDVKDWDGFKPAEPMPPEKELTEEKELIEEKELEKEDENMKDEEFMKDSPFEVETWNKDLELPIDNFEMDEVMKQEFLEKDEVLGVDSFEQTENFNKTGEMNRQGFFEQTNNFSGGGN